MSGSGTETKDFVLVVEDSRAVGAKLCSKLEENLEVEVRLATSYAEAEDVMTKRQGEIFLAVLDLLLPDAPEGEIVDLALGREIPSIVFTSDFDEMTRRNVFSKDIIDFIVKDRDAIDDIVALIRHLRGNRELKALVVDDSVSFRTATSNMLTRYMMQTFTAEGGEQAMEILAENPDISLVITDFEMPGMDGVQLCRAIRKQHNRDNLAIIAMSTVGKKTLSARFLKNGANDFIHKPFEAEELFCRVRHNVDTLARIKELQQLSKLKNRFLGMAAHDLRSPINGIKGFSEMLIEELDECMDKDQKEMMDLIHTSSSHMNDLVNDLLDITTIEEGELKLLKGEGNLTTLIRDRLKVHNFASKKKNITLELDLNEVPIFQFDVRRVVQVVDNYITNAIKFSPPLTTVTIKLVRDEDQVVCSVADQGQGIPAGEEGKLFKTFQKTSAAPTAGEKSTGLGLSIVKKIVEEHGGKVWCESEPGNGATFFFSLPMQGMVETDG